MVKIGEELNINRQKVSKILKDNNTSPKQILKEEIAKLHSENFTNSEIASKLSISPIFFSWHKIKI